MSHPSAERAQRAARSARLMAAAAILLTLVGAGGVSAMATTAALAGLNGPDIGPAIVHAWAGFLPVLIFVLALWHLRGALGEFAEGRFFSTNAAKAVRRAGVIALFAMLAKVTITPSLQSWTGDAISPQVSFDAADFALIAFLAFVALIGNVLDLAVAIKTENDGFV